MDPERAQNACACEPKLAVARILDRLPGIGPYKRLTPSLSEAVGLVETLSYMRDSLVHDALYQLMRVVGVGKCPEWREVRPCFGSIPQRG